MRWGASIICCDNTVCRKWSVRSTFAFTRLADTLSGAVFSSRSLGQEDIDPQTLRSVDGGDKWGLCWDAHVQVFSWFSEALHCTILSAGDNRADVLIPNSCCPHVQMSSDQTLMSSALVAYAAICVCVCLLHRCCTEEVRGGSRVWMCNLSFWCKIKISFLCLCTQGIWLFCIAVREKWRTTTTTEQYV